MIRKLLVLSAVVIILAGAYALWASSTGYPWPFSFTDRPVGEIETSIPPSLVMTFEPPPPELTMAPPTMTPTDVPTAVPTNTVPVCFTVEQLPPIGFSPDGARIFVRASSGVQVFDYLTGSLEAFIKSSQPLTSAAISPDGNTLAWGLQDGTVQLVDLSTQKVLADLVGHPDAVNDLLFSPSGDKLYSASHDGLVRIWDMSGDQLAPIEAGADVLGFGLSSDGSKLATIPFDGPVSIWDLADNTKILELAGIGGYDTSDAYFSPDGKYLAADLTPGIYLWRLADAELVWHQVVNSMAVSFSPDGKYLAYSDIDDNNKVVLASPDTAQEIRVVDNMQTPVWVIFFSPDSSLVSVTDGTQIKIRRVADGELLSVGKAACP